MGKKTELKPGIQSHQGHLVSSLWDPVGLTAADLLCDGAAPRCDCPWTGGNVNILLAGSGKGNH
jgi:hypothetical protein